MAEMSDELRKLIERAKAHEDAHATPDATCLECRVIVKALANLTPPPVLPEVKVGTKFLYWGREDDFDEVEEVRACKDCGAGSVAVTSGGSREVAVVNFWNEHAPIPATDEADA